MIHVGWFDLPADQVAPATVARHLLLENVVHVALALLPHAMFYNVRLCQTTPLMSGLSHEGLRPFPVRRSGYAEHWLRVQVRKGCSEQQLFPEGTTQRLQMIAELLVPSHVVQSAGGEAFVQDTDELVKAPRVRGTTTQTVER